MMRQYQTGLALRIEASNSAAESLLLGQEGLCGIKTAPQRLSTQGVTPEWSGGILKRKLEQGTRSNLFKKQLKRIVNTQISRDRVVEEAGRLREPSPTATLLDAWKTYHACQAD